MKTQIVKWSADKARENLEHELNVLQILENPWLKALYLTFQFIRSAGILFIFYNGLEALGVP
jgi:hypothetical protein